MTDFLPNVFRLTEPRTLFLFALLLGSGVAAHAQADLRLSDFTLTAGTERTFDYSITIMNAGDQKADSYSLLLTFSADQYLDGLDYFSILVSPDAATQSLAAGQSVTKNLHFEASAVNKYLPTGTWNVIAEVNIDHSLAETDFGNNQVVSDNTITIDPYTAQFLLPPTVSEISDHSFQLNYGADEKIYHTYYRYQFKGLPAPDIELMRSSSSLTGDVPLTIMYLGPAQAYDVYFMGESRDGNVTDILKVEATTAGTASPTVIASESQLTLYPTGVSNESISALVDVYGFHLTSPVIVKVSGGFSVSLDDATYDSQIELPVSDFEEGASKRIFIRAQGFDTPGYKPGSCALTTTGSSEQTITLGVVVFSHYATDFEGISSLEESGWRTYSVSGAQSWSLVNLEESSVDQRGASQNSAMQIDGTDGSPVVNEDWLISPEVDLTSFTLTPMLRFRAYRSGDSEPLVLLYSADYPGYGDPRYFTWFDSKAVLSNTATGWQNVVVKLLGQEEHLHFAFVYQSSETKAPRWTIDDWRITDNLVNIPDTELVFEDVSVGTTSEPQTLLVSVAGYGTVTISASDEFQVSVDGVVFSPAVVVPEMNITAGILLKVRYMPMVFAEETTGTLTFTSASGLSVTRNSLVGRPGLTTSIAEKNTSTGFLYPNPTEGDVHVDLSTLSGSDTVFPVMIANSIGSSVAQFDAPAYNLDNTLSTIVTKLEPGVYFVVIKGASGTRRTKLIRK